MRVLMRRGRGDGAGEAATVEEGPPGGRDTTVYSWRRAGGVRSRSRTRVCAAGSAMGSRVGSTVGKPSGAVSTAVPAASGNKPATYSFRERLVGPYPLSYR